MNGVALNRIPGYQQALLKARAKQSRIRENAWKNLPRSLFGFTIRTMLVRDYLVLDHYGSPFLNRLEPQLCDLTFFLWAMSPQCNEWNDRRYQFGRGLDALLYTWKAKRKFSKDKPDYAEGEVCFQSAVAGVFGYIEEMFLDAPPAIRGGQESGVCYLASWFDLIQSQHHISDEQIWRMPLPQLFQRVQAIRLRMGDKVPVFSKEEDDLKRFIQDGISSRKFTMDDLAQGKVDFSDN